MSHLCSVEMRITCLIFMGVSLLCGVESLGLEEAPQAGVDTGSQQPVHREKKDIAKLQALFGGWKQPKPYPILAFEEIKKPVYYVPPVQQQQQPCNCNWRPSTRYGDGGFPALVIPARPALPAHHQPPAILPALPARQAPLPPVIPAAPAVISAEPPCPPEAGGYHYDRPSHH